MTKRKPAHLSFPGWVEQQVRQAEAQGAFDNLPGAGRPIPDLDRAGDPLAWVANHLHRENVDVADLLPPALRLPKEVETLDKRLPTMRSEAVVRAVIDDLNRRIDDAYARPQVGPPLRVKKVNVEQAVERWRATLPPPPAPPASAPPKPPRRWQRIRRRSEGFKS
jgi:hypothetical protein